MNKCPTCHRARCRWVEFSPDVSRIKTKRIKEILDHNYQYIEMAFSGHQGSANAEERMIARLEPLQIELDKRATEEDL